ncbi:MAG: hypothetical protein CMJ94_13935 [Planctomycetes bacterium]|nr:hypothetical protein [Planctomycetota bacterium]
MAEPDFARIQRIFEEAVELPAAERAAFLDRACADDPELRARVEELLAADAELDEFLEPPQGLALPADRLRQEAEDFLPEEQIGGYQLLRELGRGGRGVVYLARKPDSDQLVALKVLGSGLLPSAIAVERFRREAKANARVDHPGIVKLQLAGDDTGRPFLVMDYVEGHTLADEILLQRAQKETISLPGHLLGRSPLLPTEEAPRVRASVELVGKIAEALHHAHERGVLHRDVKPQNVLLDDQGQPHLIDFGLAEVQGERSLTRTGDVEGTPNYMSPEQVRAIKGGIDKRTDVYSLGVVLYELLTLRRPFDAPTVNQVMQNITRTMPPRIRRVVPSVPATLELLCTTAIEKRPTDRYPDMAGFARDLRAFLESRPLEAKIPSPVTRVRRAVQRRPLPYAMGLVGGIALALGAMGAGYFADSQRLEAAVDSIEAAVATPEQLDLRAVQESLAQVEGGREALPQESRQTLDQLEEDGRTFARAAVGEALLAPDLARRSVSRFVNPLSPQDGVESAVAARLVEQMTAWGLSASESSALLAEGRQPWLHIVLDGASWDEVESVQWARLGRHGITWSAWEEAKQGPVQGLFKLEPEQIGVLRLRWSGRPVTEVTVLETRSGEVRRLLVNPQGSQQLDWVSVDAATLSTDRFLNVEARKQIPTVDVARFQCQEAPVSNRIFRRFMLATELQWPDLSDWIDDSYWEEHADKPVGWVTLDEAAACAAWLGCRLPTTVEWMLAHRGPDLTFLPEGVTRDQLIAASSAVRWWQDEADWENEESETPWALLWAVEALPSTSRSGPLDRSASGMRLGLMGVVEYTVTMTGGALDSEPLREYRCCGHPAGRISGIEAVTEVSKSWDRVWFTGQDPEARQPHIGFRCVRAGG